MTVKEILSSLKAPLLEEKPFFTALIREGLQDPINGVIELGGELIHHNLPELHLVDETKPNSESARMDFLGGALGKALDFTIFSRLTHGRFSPSAETTATEAFVRGSAYGAIQGGVLTPVHTTGGSFWHDRLINMTEGAVAWGTGSAIGVKVGRFLKPAEEAEDSGPGTKALKFLFPTPRNPVAAYSRRFGSLALYGVLKDRLPNFAPTSQAHIVSAVASDSPEVVSNPTSVKLPETQTVDLPEATLMDTSSRDFTGSLAITVLGKHPER